MKEKSYKTLKNTLDRVFAKFIKVRDSQSEYFICISCNNTKPINQFNAGHYFSRGALSIRWDEKNVNGQCVHCNKWKSGNIQGYTKGLIKKYGKDIIQELEIKKMQTSKLSRFELSVLINFYKNELKKHEQN